MLTAAAKFLVRSPRPNGRSDEATILLARSYLERAVRLAPELADARAELVSVVSHTRRRAQWLFTLEAPPVSQYDAVMSLPGPDRFELLPYAAIAAYKAARQVARNNNPNMARYVHVKFENSDALRKPSWRWHRISGPIRTSERRSTRPTWCWLLMRCATDTRTPPSNT